MLDWMNITHILLMLGACYMCFAWGKTNGIASVVALFLDKGLITESDLDKLQD